MWFDQKFLSEQRLDIKIGEQSLDQEWMVSQNALLCMNTMFGCLTPENSHARMAAPDLNGGAQILRLAYSYENGITLTAERWPPWHQGMEFDAGLLFIAWQQDPRTGFVKIFDRMSKFDMMNQFTTHVGGGLFACPGGAQPGGFIGDALFRSV